MVMAKENILVICAHNDDMIIGCGGTIAKYAKEGKNVHTYVFSYGEQSHPWLKPDVVQDFRMHELKESIKILGGASVRVFGLLEGKFLDEAKKKNVYKKISDEISQKNPTKIFTHGPDDPHPDHRAVLNVVEEVIKSGGFKTDVYTFGIWNPIRLKKRNSPRLVVDTSKTFGTKIDSFKVHKSQLLTKISLMWTIYTKDIMNGLKYKYRFAEVFFKYDI